MGDFEVFLSGGMESSVKYHSFDMYILISTDKTARDSIWWVVLVGRYPWANQLCWLAQTMAPPRSLIHFENKEIRGCLFLNK